MTPCTDFSRRRFLAGLPLVSGFIVDDAGRIKRWLESIYSTEPPQAAPFVPLPGSWGPESVTAAWIGHSTVLMNLFGTVVLTDPVFSDRVGLNIGGLFTLGPQRLVSPAIALDTLPPTDLVLISHGHMDHCDLETLKQLPKTTRLIMPEQTSPIVEHLEFDRVTELKWGNRTIIGDVTIEALPVKHNGLRYPWMTSESAEKTSGPGSNAYLLSARGVHLVFAGDTAYTADFTELARRYIPVGLAILPIGGYNPHRDNHCTPEEALLMADDMDARHILPIHWGTFPGEEGREEPMERLQKAAAANPERIAVSKIGQTWRMEQ